MLSVNFGGFAPCTKMDTNDYLTKTKGGSGT